MLISTDIQFLMHPTSSQIGEVHAVWLYTIFAPLYVSSSVRDNSRLIVVPKISVDCLARAVHGSQHRSCLLDRTCTWSNVSYCDAALCTHHSPPACNWLNRMDSGFWGSGKRSITIFHRQTRKYLRNPEFATFVSYF